MAKRTKVRTDEKKFQPIVFAGFRVYVANEARYAEYQAFAKEREAELIREIQILKLEHGKSAQSSILTGILEALAFTRVWVRFKGRDDDWGRWKKPKPKAPKPLRPSGARKPKLIDA